MQIVFYLLHSSLGDFKRSKVRTFLTSLGILIGVFSVVTLLALGLGLKNYIKQQFEDLGSYQIYVFPGQLIRDGQIRNSENIEAPISFDAKDVRDLSRISGVKYVVPAFTSSVTVEYGGKTEYGDLYATTADVFPMRNLTPQVGEVWGDSDVSKGAKLAVLGPKIAEEVFGTTEAAIGKSIRVNDKRFKVVGVSVAKGGGGFGGPSFDSYLYVPYTSVSNINPEEDFGTVTVQAESEELVVPVKNEMKEILLRRYEETEFSLVEQTEILNIVGSIFGIINSVLVAIASISLIVGGIGIMNIMYATVNERTKEVGIRRAIGATRRDILLQFLSQAVTLSLVGGLVGLILAVIVVILIQPLFPAAISFVSVAAALGISSGIGIFFGVFPARRAANLSPIEAIRYE